MDYAKRGILSQISLRVEGGRRGEGWLQEDKKFKLNLAKCRVLCRLGVFFWGGGWGKGS